MDGLEDDAKCAILLGGGDDTLRHEDAILSRRSQIRTLKENFIEFIDSACTRRRALLSGLKGGGNALVGRLGVLPEGVT